MSNDYLRRLKVIYWEVSFVAKVCTAIMDFNFYATSPEFSTEGNQGWLNHVYVFST